MKALMSVLVACVIVGGSGFVDRVDAGDRGKGRRHGRIEERHDRRADRRGDRYFADRDVYVIREYYRPYYRPLPRGARPVYARAGYLPPGWAKRMRPVPIYVERGLPPLPRGYRRGIIDGHAIVYNPGGLIIDVAVLF